MVVITSNLDLTAVQQQQCDKVWSQTSPRWWVTGTMPSSLLPLTTSRAAARAATAPTLFSSSFSTAVSVSSSRHLSWLAYNTSSSGWVLFVSRKAGAGLGCGEVGMQTATAWLPPDRQLHLGVYGRDIKTRCRSKVAASCTGEADQSGGMGLCPCVCVGVSS